MPRRRRRRWIVGIVLALLAALLTIVIGIVALVATGHSDFGDTNTIRMTPTSAEALPIVIKEDAAEVLLDLTQLDSDDFDDLDAPALVDIRLDAGSIRVIVPSDLAIEVDAKVNIGQVVIDQESDSGFDSRLSVRDANPDVTIEIDLDVGEIIVDRLSATQALLEVR